MYIEYIKKLEDHNLKRDTKVGEGKDYDISEARNRYISAYNRYWHYIEHCGQLDIGSSREGIQRSI